jgi:hypothetical protein
MTPSVTCALQVGEIRVATESPHRGVPCREREMGPNRGVGVPGRAAAPVLISHMFDPGGGTDLLRRPDRARPR